MINICSPTLNRYDCLQKMIESAMSGTIKPDKFYIIDNGGELKFRPFPNVEIIKPGTNLGVAGSWNWFLKSVPEVRIIVNDDVIFENDTLERFMAGYSDNRVTSPDSINGSNAYSFFSIPDFVVNTVGEFDTQFFPAYFEDNDYEYRCGLKSLVRQVALGCNVIHSQSSTLKMFNSEQLSKHHANFGKNQTRYIQKWGGLPGKELFHAPFNRG